MLLQASLDAFNTCCKMDDETTTPKAHPALDRTTSFIRAHDLDLSEEDVAKCCAEAASDGDELRKISIDKELLSLEGNGSGAIMSALVTIGLKEATDESSRWSATGSTDKIIKKRGKQLKKGKPNNTAEAEIMGPWENAASGNDVFVWHSKCTRPGHGSDYPVAKSRGLIPASAKDVVELLKDSNRVMEYNKMSVGREDQHVLTKDLNSSVHCLETKCPQLGVTGEAKIMSSKNQPPLTRKPLEFKTLFYARHLNRDDGVEMDGAAYVTVGRSVWETPEGTTDGCDGSTTRCELLLSVNLVREITTENGEKWCELTSITHAVSPGIPIFIGKQIALNAAENYIKDIRALFEK
mmetsp:Transcript_551/g.1083  ORF Transcript_551/g.1083 Transcript_551/m.1083 type:complete len:352 (+) Transcript_551:112-1167(+)